MDSSRRAESVYDNVVCLGTEKEACMQTSAIFALYRRPFEHFEFKTS